MPISYSFWSNANGGRIVRNYHHTKQDHRSQGIVPQPRAQLERRKFYNADKDQCDASLIRRNKHAEGDGQGHVVLTKLIRTREIMCNNVTSPRSTLTVSLTAEAL